MRKFHMSPLARAVGIMGAVAVIVTGVTFAALNSQTTLSGNTISATPGLQLSTNGGTTYGGSVQGFAFNLTPGDTTGVSETFLLKNTTSSAMTLSLSVPTAVTFTGGTVNNSDIHVALACTTPTLSISPATDLGTLTTGKVPITGTLSAGTASSCTITATMDNAAITSGSSVTSNSFGLLITGV